MKKVLTFLLLTFLMTFPLASNIFAQVTCTTQEQNYGSCVGGDCYCWSMTISCSEGTTCVRSGGYCDYGEVSISWVDGSCSSPV
jgi:hypothetical protein